MERAKRNFAKEGLILHKHKAGNRDYLMNGNLYAYVTNEADNQVSSYWDYEGFIAVCKESSILKSDEVVA